MTFRRASRALILVAIGCSDPLPEQQAHDGRPTVQVFVEPARDPAALESVSRFRVRTASEPVPPDELWLFRGELSAYALSRIQARDVPKSLSDRQVPGLAWIDGGETVLAVTQVLEVGETYALATPSAGNLGTFAATSSPQPVLARIWPPRGAPAGAEYAVYCGAEPLASLDLASFYEPGHIPARVRPGNTTAGDVPAECLVLEPASPLPRDIALVPPLAKGGPALDPAPLSLGPPTALDSVPCAAEEVALGPGCVEVEDDRAVLRCPQQPGLWSLFGDLEPELVALDGGDRVLVRGLAPGASYHVSFEVHGLGATPVGGSATWHTAAAREHVVVNEVMANPLGAEPAEEWVELVNDGVAAVDLAGYVLEDSGGKVELPSFSLEPSSFVLLVREDFVPADGSDVPPADGTPLIRLPTLGKNGLSNSGEKLALRRADGSLASTFPALPKPKAGVSVARAHPWSFDDAADAFAWHAAPGASPGTPNVIDDAP